MLKPISLEFIYGSLFLVLFSLSAVAGMTLRKHLHERHLTAENMDAIRLVTGLMVTFAALILSLQLSTARTSFDAASKDRAVYAARLATLDQCLHGVGAAAEPTRLLLRQYTAAVIASTWPREPSPGIAGMPDTSSMAVRGEDSTLSQLMNKIGAAIDALIPTDAADVNALARCRAAYGTAVTARWTVIEDTHEQSGGFFIGVVSFWLSLVFLSFGMQIPSRALSVVVLAIGVISVSSVMFVIVDLNIPYQGLFNISSSAMRDALAEMTR